MSVEEFVTWRGAPIRVAPAGSPATAARPPAVPAAGRKVRSLLRARANAVILDGLLLSAPLVLIDWLMGALFPHDGFFSSSAPSHSFYAFIGPSGGLLIVALWLSYFAVSESLTGQTLGKRWMGLRVISIDGGPAGIAAVSARSVLRLIDDLGFYLVGLIPMLLTGERRRRFGDLAGRTLVVPVESTSAPLPRPGLRAAIYPLAWLTSVMIVVFGLGLGSAAGASDQAIALVRSYENARASGNAALACSLLARDQQRELVALVTRDYRHATAGACPQFVLSNGGASSTVSPRLAQFVAGPLVTRRTVLGGVHVISPDLPDISLYAISENGRNVLDARGLQKLSFVRSCTGAGRAPTGGCMCVYEWLRAQQIDPYGYNRESPVRIRRTLAVDARRCAGDPAGPA
ncbi:MAG TPA: RDD family protein [Solirubrobacteraceae bacterium]|nr:RDD family protein [Solirubrobacteraceae bacterium]